MDSLELYRFHEAENLLTPALLIYPDLVEINIKSTLGLFGGDADRWRPHVKTAKLRFVMELLLQHGIRNFKAATTLELLTLCQLGAPDVLLAHPVVGSKQKRVAEMARQYPQTRISVIVETPESAQAWDGLPVGVFVDLNPGMDRTGVAKDRVLAVVAAVGSLRGFRGIHYYDGHINGQDFTERTRLAHAGYEELMVVIRELQALGIAVPELITSGTPTFPCASSFLGFRGESFIHRVSPGTIVYCDMMSLRQVPANAGYVPAALVLSTVVSHPRPKRLTCDAGHKTVSADAGVPTCAVVGHPDFLPAAPSEEHLPLDVPDAVLPGIGEQLFLLPRHICPTVNNFDHAVLVRNGRIQGVEQVTARGREAPILPMTTRA